MSTYQQIVIVENTMIYLKILTSTFTSLYTFKNLKEEFTYYRIIIYLYNLYIANVDKPWKISARFIYVGF